MKKKTLKVTYVRSAIGYNKNQMKILEALGFKNLTKQESFLITTPFVEVYIM